MEPRKYSIKTEGDKGGSFKLLLSGAIALDTLTIFMKETNTLLGNMDFTEITIDLGGIEYLDSSGALALVRIEENARQKSVPLGFMNMTADTKRIVGLIDYNALYKPPYVIAKKMPGFFERLGNSTIWLFRDIVLLMLFIGDLFSSLTESLLHPLSVRWDAVLFYMKRAGVDGLPIVGLISILIGLIMAFMASLQLRLVGANIYVASLVTVAIVRELGPIMTAIIVAGRSGSAFAAEIGTMMVNDEVDALTVMGFDPVKFLVVPKVLAAIVVVPILTLYSDLLGILGGLLVGVIGMDLTFYAYMQQTMNSFDVFDVVSSLFKSVCFAGLIAGISCHRGFQAKSGAESVGSAATSAVVASIFLIVVTDSAFAIMLQYIR
jgi:phospholipid/cholesterol/gamma-HCH transport system permease protein